MSGSVDKMEGSGTTAFPCDLCGADEPLEIPEARLYTGDQPLHACGRCGFVYVRDRRDSQAIADSWSNDIYGDTYTARMPAVKARQTFVADMMDVELEVQGKWVVDIGSGEGQFLEILAAPPYNARVLGIEPSAANCKIMASQGIDAFEGTVESFLASNHPAIGQADIVTIMWTLENCEQCNVMVDAARRILKPGGHVLIATGSRLMVPFKKPLHTYLGTNPADTHCFRFSRNTLNGLLAKHGFANVAENQWLTSEWMVLIGEKRSETEKLEWTGDDPGQVLDFFRRWHQETEQFYPRQTVADPLAQ